MSQLPRVGDHDDVGREIVVVLAEQVGQRVRPDLLLALDEHRDAHAEVLAERADGAEVGDDPGLVVGCAAAEEPRPSRSVGSNGGEFHSAWSFSGCTSWWA